MNERVIVKCDIEQGKYITYIWATYNDSVIECVGTYYADELYFTEDEFIGLTKQEARDLMHRKDVAYLRS